MKLTSWGKTNRGYSEIHLFWHTLALIFAIHFLYENNLPEPLPVGGGGLTFDDISAIGRPHVARQMFSVLGLYSQCAEYWINPDP